MCVRVPVLLSSSGEWVRVPEASGIVPGALFLVCTKTGRNRSSYANDRWLVRLKRRAFLRHFFLRLCRKGAPPGVALAGNSPPLDPRRLWPGRASPQVPFLLLHFCFCLIKIFLLDFSLINEFTHVKINYITYRSPQVVFSGFITPIALR